ncbi:MAG: hypothetical protein COV74_01265 [Candidatus Omnitrophica bacterium CG11_big_fil_rev_8_21_14_0_20_45_26]|uniref:Uncharacterized protein n=1 Tax=Candidatus Abzuiibacterium crystallinum TaxID=1974748 RepID=A0A2H0LRW3_9BACT|nr:MAG: hypothetical protein COV74_01265 [Candidatus Omnitrophica bacterium CG11_big_fil_rev_8_21_14_0_20_45_26]PIW64800.1 MAG: hypothetical protein COW12_04675 [Candidatus Omnitrophica bacterium CG12_big_fil_rev_8_21_14_0_65_45_16]
MNPNHFLTFLESLNNLHSIGLFVRWYEILGLGGIMFAIFEFMEKSKLRSYIFRFGNLSRNIFGLLLFSVITVGGSNLLAIANVGAFGFIPLISYPVFWEVLSLMSFTVALIGMLFYSIRPMWFAPRINYRNSVSFVQNISRAIHNDQSDDSFGAIVAILDLNSGTIFRNAARFDSWWNVQGSTDKTPFETFKVPKKERVLVECCVELIDHTLSDRDLCNYLATHHIGFLLRMIDEINKVCLWRSCGNIFMDSICEELFLDPNSHLSRELNFRGVGLRKPVFNKLFRSLELVSYYRPHQSFPHWKPEKLTIEVINKYTEALEISLEEYFKKERSLWVADTPNHALAVALRHLSDMIRSLCGRVRKLTGDSIYQNSTGEMVASASYFFGPSRLETIFCVDERKKYFPRFSKEELAVSKDSVTEGVVAAIFEYLSTLAVIEDDDYARMLSCEVFWLIFGHSEQKEVIKMMEKRLLKMISERIEENKKGHYSPMVRLLINIYGFNFHQGIDEKAIIGKYIENEFKEYFAQRILDNEADAKKFLPTGCSIDKENRIIKDHNRNVMYQASNIQKIRHQAPIRGTGGLI